jgi:hypothetical protein
MKEPSISKRQTPIFCCGFPRQCRQSLQALLHNQASSNRSRSAAGRLGAQRTPVDSLCIGAGCRQRVNDWFLVAASRSALGARAEHYLPSVNQPGRADVEAVISVHRGLPDSLPYGLPSRAAYFFVQLLQWQLPRHLQLRQPAPRLLYQPLPYCLSAVLVGYRGQRLGHALAKPMGALCEAVCGLPAAFQATLEGSKPHLK